MRTFAQEVDIRMQSKAIAEFIQVAAEWAIADDAPRKIDA